MSLITRMVFVGMVFLEVRRVFFNFNLVFFFLLTVRSSGLEMSKSSSSSCRGDFFPDCSVPGEENGKHTLIKYEGMRGEGL